jgi:predicted transcriptional regulator
MALSRASNDEDDSYPCRIDEQLDRDLRALAAATGRSRSWLVAAALKSYVEAEKEFIEAVEQGIAAADEGRLVDPTPSSPSWIVAIDQDEEPLDRSGGDRLSGQSVACPRSSCHPRA